MKRFDCVLFGLLCPSQTFCLNVLFPVALDHVLDRCPATMALLGSPELGCRVAVT